MGLVCVFHNIPLSVKIPERCCRIFGILAYRVFLSVDFEKKIDKTKILNIYKPLDILPRNAYTRTIKYILGKPFERMGLQS